MEFLTRQVLKANEQHKIALDQYTRKLRTELDTVNKLIVRPISFASLRFLNHNNRLLSKIYPMITFRRIQETNGVYTLMGR